MIKYEMMPVINCLELARELESIYGRQFNLISSIFNPPGNDCYISFSYCDGPLDESEIEDYRWEYWEDFNCVCKYLQSLNLPNGKTVIVDTSW